MDSTTGSIAKVYVAKTFPLAQDRNQTKFAITGYQINESLELVGIDNLYDKKIEDLQAEGWMDIRDLKIGNIPVDTSPRSLDYKDYREKLISDFNGTNLEWIEVKTEKLSDVHLYSGLGRNLRDTYDAEKNNSSYSHFALNNSELKALYESYQREKGLSSSVASPATSAVNSLIDYASPSISIELSEQVLSLDPESITFDNPINVDALVDETRHEEAVTASNLNEMRGLDMANESIAQVYDSDDAARLDANHRRMAIAQSQINSLQSQAIAKNPRSQRRLNRGISGSLTTSEAAEQVAEEARNAAKSKQPPPLNPYQLNQTLDLFLLDLRDRLARIDMVGDRELPNLKIVVNNQEVYHRIDSVPQKLPARIDSKDLDYLSRAIDLPQGTQDTEMNRDLRIKVDGKVVFELVAGEVTTNLLPQGQRNQEQGVAIGLSNQVTASPLEQLLRSSEQPSSTTQTVAPDELGSGDRSMVDKGFAAIPMATPLSDLQRIKNSTGAMTLSSSIDKLSDGKYTLEKGIDIKKETDSNGNSLAAITDSRDLENPKKYLFETDNKGNSTFKDSDEKEIFRIENSVAVVSSLDSSQVTLFNEIESLVTQNTLDSMREQAPEIKSVIEAPESSTEKQLPRIHDKQDEIDF